MAPITTSTEIERSAEEVFAYVTEVTTAITEYEPPRRWADRGIDGPVRAIVAATVEPLGDGSRSRVTIDLDFTGHGIGKLLVPLVVRRQAAGEMPDNMRRLKRRLEAREEIDPEVRRVGGE